MPGNPLLNGCDYLMLGFDHESRRLGFAGNSCQILLELGSSVAPAAIRERLVEVYRQYPVLGARPGGWFRPRWRLPRRAVPAPDVRVHRPAPDLPHRLFNTPLSSRQGETVRFELIERDGSRPQLIFTWAHALMDAPGAEYFLALVGRPDLPWPASHDAEPGRNRRGFLERLKLARKNVDQLDAFCRAAPRTPARRRQVPPAVHYRVERFSPEETERARANSVRHCGILGEGQFHAAVAMLELHGLHERLGWKSASYVLPLPVGLRRKGCVEPLFSNQVTMLMTQFLPEELTSIERAVSTLKTQTQAAMRDGLLQSGIVLSEFSRFLPLSLYMALLKQGLRGEICSLFYGDTAAVHPALTQFLGAPVEDFTHVAAITPSPGLGVVFYSFRGRLRVTVLHSTLALTDEEAAAFAASLRTRLLQA